jgi:aminoacrylate hydrolase
MPKLQINDTEIYYEESGSGYPVCLVMGFGGTTQSWSKQVPAISKTFRTIVFDHRGCGRSAQPEGGYNIQQFSDDAVALLEALGVSRAHFVGYSMGGRVCQDLAARYPELVQSLVLAATAANLNPLNEYCLKASAYLYETFGPEAAAAFDPVLGFTRAYFGRHLKDLVAALGQPVAEPVPLHVYKGHIEAIKNHDTTAVLSRIAAPTMVMLGDHEWLNALPESMALVQGIPNAKIKMLAGGGHGFHWEIPETFNDEVLDFIGEHTPEKGLDHLK